MTELTKEQLNNVFRYHEHTGLFEVLINRQGNCARAGSFIEGSKDKHGYRVIMINGKNYKAHRLAWLAYYGKWPNGQIDHLDGVRHNNKISNLREVSCAQNSQNQKSKRPKNKSSGLLGVCYIKPNKKYRSAIKIDGKVRYLGNHATAEEAHAAYIAAKRELHPYGNL